MGDVSRRIFRRRGRRRRVGAGPSCVAMGDDKLRGSFLASARAELARSPIYLPPCRFGVVLLTARRRSHAILSGRFLFRSASGLAGLKLAALHGLG